MIDIIELFGGYAIRKTDENGKKWYFTSIHNGDYKWSSDYLYARIMTPKTAKKHRVKLCLADENFLPVVYINCRRYPFCDSILYGTKKYETRTKNTLRLLVGKTCLFCETGNGKPRTRFYACIDSVVKVTSKEQFEKYRNDCDILPGSDFDWNDKTTVKYLYHLSDIVGEDEYEIEIPSELRHGRTWAEKWFW